jgi:tryptophanyl-tRNA synthetase
MEEPKVLDGSLVGDLYKLFATHDQVADLTSRLAKGGMGWGHAKDELFGVINDHVKEMRAQYVELRKDEKNLHSVLAQGAERARDRAQPTLNRVRHAFGIR